MRTRTFATLGTLALLAAGAAFGQSRLVADIPFEFSMANKVMPAGHYEVSQTAVMVQVSCFECRAGALVTAINLGNASAGNTVSHLVFNQYGDKYFLGEIWTSPGYTSGAGVLKSKTEREVAGANPEVARVNVPLRKAGVTLAAIR